MKTSSSSSSRVATVPLGASGPGLAATGVHSPGAAERVQGGTCLPVSTTGSTPRAGVGACAAAGRGDAAARTAMRTALQHWEVVIALSSIERGRHAQRARLRRGHGGVAELVRDGGVSGREARLTGDALD